LFPILFGAENNVDCPFTTKTKSGTIAKSVDFLSTADADGSPLVFLANTSQQKRTFAIMARESKGLKFTDLITGKAVDTDNIALQRNEVMLLGVE